MAQSRLIHELFSAAPVIPVLVIEDANDARPLGEALVAGGLPVLEVTLRTPAAIKAIHAMSDITGAYVGAGTVLTDPQAGAAKQAGATFAVSPGSTGLLRQACVDHDLPLLPGAATPSEAMTLLEAGYDHQKFFPAEAAGGVPMLSALTSPLSQITFCPTGGVSTKNKDTYLALRNVKCVGGSWVAPKKLIKAKDWSAIEELAREAATSGPS